MIIMVIEKVFTKTREEFDGRSGCDDVFYSAGFRVSAQFSEIEDMVDGLDERRPTRLDSLQERKLRVIERAIPEKFGCCKNLVFTSMRCKLPTI